MSRWAESVKVYILFKPVNFQPTVKWLLHVAAKSHFPALNYRELPTPIRGRLGRQCRRAAVRIPTPSQRAAMTSICFSRESTFTKLILRVEGMAFGETLANQPCKAYIYQMVIRFGLIPGAVIGAVAAATTAVPLIRILGSPAGIRTRTSPRVTASVLPLDQGALEPIRGRYLFLYGEPGSGPFLCVIASAAVGTTLKLWPSCHTCLLWFGASRWRPWPFEPSGTGPATKWISLPLHRYPAPT